ncbi:MAG: 4-hydroxythreonine-4-phosphate dehydrogenase PdxA [Pyrinomonadaceae bacterium]
MSSKLTKRPRIGITIGDAAGIGPEVVLKSLQDVNLRASCNCIVIGDGRHLRNLAEVHGVDLERAEIHDLANLPAHFEMGVDDAVTGKAAGENIEAAVKLWRDGKIDSICTAPISKTAIQLGGYSFPGHTEMLAELMDTKQFAMSFFADKLRIVLLSTHHSLREAIDLVKKEALVELIKFSDQELRRLLRRDVKFAVAGLNPHASEGGKFGSEESDEIEPAILYCRDELNIDVSGPYSPDTIFLRGFRGEFDAVIALYHDQATIAVKSISFGAGVNVTLGLPLIRTSVDHGTAYDIAVKWIADESSMRAAIKLAGELTQNSHDAA